MEVIQSLQEHYPSGFFHDNEKKGPNHIHKLPQWLIDTTATPCAVEVRMSSEKPFAEGAQAQLFRAHMIAADDGPDGTKYEKFVMKVFEEGPCETC